jgi:predicted metal-dependent hydrolase
MADVYKTGLEHLRAGRFFAAHEELELAWRAAPEPEHEGVQVADVRRQLRNAQAVVLTGSLDLLPPSL